MVMKEPEEAVEVRVSRTRISPKQWLGSAPRVHGDRKKLQVWKSKCAQVMLRSQAPVIREGKRWKATHILLNGAVDYYSSTQALFTTPLDIHSYLLLENVHHKTGHQFAWQEFHRIEHSRASLWLQRMRRHVPIAHWVSEVRGAAIVQRPSDLVVEREVHTMQVFN